MRSGSDVPVICPSVGSTDRALLPSTGSRRSGSPASAVLRGHPPSRRPFRRTSFPSLGDTILASEVSCLPWRSDAATTGLELFTGDPHPASRVGNDEISQVPGEPCAGMPCSLTPVRPQRQAISAHWCCLPFTQRRRLSQVKTISGLDSTAYLLAVYASQPGSPPNHARLASGCWPA